MITKEQLDEIKEVLLTPSEPIYTLDDLHTLYTDYSNRKGSDELDKFLLGSITQLIDLKIQLYDIYPFYADNILKYYHDQSNN